MANAVITMDAVLRRHICFQSGSSSEAATAAGPCI